MKTSIHSVALALLLSSAVSVAFALDKPATNASKGMTMTNLIQQLQTAGYTVKDAQFNKDDGTFKVEAIDRQGEKQSFDVNSKEGLPSELKTNAKPITLLVAVKKVEKPGIIVKSAEIDSDSYKVVVLDNTGNEIVYKIDMKNGQVTKG